ncbi:MAG TPA: nuclear transport factor 2 family protein [Terriglobales bacterium]|nr:nuclear transport factor 2 family protein [Terriglobales bacterium]
MYRPFSASFMPSGSLPDVESLVRGLTQDFCMAFNTANHDQVGALFAGDGLFMTPHHDPAQGSRAIEQALREYSDSGYQDLRMETLRVTQSGDIAIEIGRYEVSIRNEDGRTMIEKGNFIHAWRRMGAWRMIASCWNTSLPPLKQTKAA